jgi:hypothetical protein
MKRNVKRAAAIVAAGLFGASHGSTMAFAAAQNRINARPVPQMQNGKAFLKPAATLQGMRLQLKRNEGAKALNPQPLPPGPGTMMRAGATQKALNPQPLPPGPDTASARAAAQNRQAVSSQINRLQSMQQQLNNNAFNSNTSKALNPQPLPPGPDKTRTSAAAQNRQAVSSQVNKLQSMQRQINSNVLKSNMMGR